MLTTSKEFPLGARTPSSATERSSKEFPLADKARTPILIIGYGNTLRSDDGVGPKIAEAVLNMRFPGVQALAMPQLTPELADPISRADVVIFVDAAVDSSREVKLRKLLPTESSQIIAHACNPRTMLALARDVFDHQPDAWLVTIPVENLELGEQLSVFAQTGLDRALKKILALAPKVLAPG